ncbi:MAG: hypothetical protein GY930_02215 [bacterium]|nr:hypothetical protein [bacterium]
MIKSLYLAPILAISLSGLASATDADGLFARLDVRSGRVQVIQSEGSESTLRKGENLSVRGATHLEISSGSEVRISYPGVASMHVWGPASLDWQSVPTQQVSNLKGLEQLSSAGIAWNIFNATWCDLEVRRGRHLLQMPGDWSAVMEGGSVRLRGLATGPLEVRVNAGDPLRLYWSGDQSHARPPLTVYPGSNLRLERPMLAKVDQSGNAQAWQNPVWPYRKSTETLTQNQQRQGRALHTRKTNPWPSPGAGSSNTGTKTQVGIVPKVDRVQVQVQTRQTQPVAEVDRSSPNLPPIAQIAPVLQPSHVSPVQPQDQDQVQPQRLVRDTTYVGDHWRNVSLNKLKACGAVVVENRAGVEMRVFAGGRRKILVDRFDGSSTWVFGPSEDFQLLPGAVAVFDENGKLVLSYGDIKSYPSKGLRADLKSIQR